MDDPLMPSVLIADVLDDIASEAETVMLTASALENHASRISNHAAPQAIRESAALLKSTALALIAAAAGVVGSSERLRLVAELAEFEAPGGDNLPS